MMQFQLVNIEDNSIIIKEDCEVSGIIYSKYIFEKDKEGLYFLYTYLEDLEELDNKSELNVTEKEHFKIVLCYGVEFVLKELRKKNIRIKYLYDQDTLERIDSIKQYIKENSN